MLKRPRLSRIYYNGRFFDYPLKPVNALTGLGLMNAIVIMASYVWSRIHPIRPEVSVEDWVTNRFGRRLYRIFFKTYTEKVWGIPCNTIGAQWAAQRIRGLSLRVAVTNALFGRFNRNKGAVKTLIDEFEYPRLGPGMMWEAFQRDLEDRGCPVELRTGVRRIFHDGAHVTAIETEHEGRPGRRDVSAVVSTMPLRDLIRALTPAAPAEVAAAAERLRYRDFLTVALVVDQADVFPDNWIYVHDPAVKLGRIQNFKNWSPEMVPDASKTFLGLEYFCSEGDELWSMSDEALSQLGARELETMGLARAADVEGGTVIRQLKTYPVYTGEYKEYLERIRGFLDSISNLQTVGRNGLHMYNNQDHSMLTAMLAVKNLRGEQHDVWSVNVERAYHEEVRLPSGAVD
jgi:protoporphyrinogen oxidase